jgi:hypothetical protein
MRYAIVVALSIAAAGALASAAPPAESSAVRTGDSPLYLGLEPEPEPAAAVVPEAAPGKIPGGLVDAEWKCALIPGADGLVEAIDLRTGKTLFASASRAQLLALSNDRVYVLAGAVEKVSGNVVVRVLAMSIKGQGKYVFASKPLPLPDWVAAGKSSYVSGAATIADGKLALHWNASGVEPANVVNWRFRGRWGGADMNPALSAAGDFSVDLTTGETKVAEPPAAPAAAPGAGPAVGPVGGVGMLMIGPGMVSPAVFESAAPRWKAEAVSHGGLNYVLSVQTSREPVLTCFDPQARRTLWQRTLDLSPGAMPALRGSTTVVTPGDGIPIPQREEVDW